MNNTRANKLTNISCTMIAILLVSLFSSVATAEDGFVSLFDGKTLNGWVTLDDKPVTQGWEVENGTIHLKVGKERAGYIKTTRTFENFELEFQWRVAEGGNSGVKYLAKESQSDFGLKYFGCEYQLLDDKNHKNGRTPNKTAGSLYDLYPPSADQKRLRPIGQFNDGKIVVNDGRIEHWLNGNKILEANIGSEDWQTKVSNSKVSSVKEFANGPGVILLQEHLSEAWFKNIRIKPLNRSSVAQSGVPKPIAHWKLDDIGDVAQDSVGEHHGKIVGAKSAAGKLGKSLEFVRKQGNYIEVPFAKDLALSTFTVSAWVYLTREPTFSGILGTRHGGDHTFDMKVNAAKVHGDIGNGKNWIETAVNFYAKDTGTNGEGGDLALNRWYHIVYVIDSNKKECRLYLNADLKQRIGFKGVPMLMTPANTMHIGHSSGTEFMDGMIDDVRIWNQALTTEQVESLWTAAAKD